MVRCEAYPVSIPSQNGDDTEGMHPSRKALAEATNPRHVHGSLQEALNRSKTGSFRLM